MHAWALQVMGNSLAQWHRSYDLNFAQRIAQPAVDAMAKWRAAQLVKAGALAAGASKAGEVLAARRRQFVLFDSDDEVPSEESEGEDIMLDLEEASDDSDDEA